MRSECLGYRTAAFASVLPVLALIVGAGCHEPARDFHPPPADGEDLPVLRQITGTHSHETRAMQVVVREPAMLARIPLADVPVNFADEMLLIVTLGRVTSDRYAVDVTRVWREGGKLRTEVTVTAPTEGSPVVMASPYCIAVVPRCDLNVADFAVEPPNRTRSWEQSTPPENWQSPSGSSKSGKGTPKKGQGKTPPKSGGNVSKR